LEIRSLRPQHKPSADSAEEFNHLGVRLVSVQDQIDTDSPMGRATFTIIGAMAELESSLISERVTAASSHP
jgi:DNA invertase Pin-like site-specific DNA recombinase